MLNLVEILQGFNPINLEEMDSVSLMNRVDCKFVMSTNQLPRILESLQSTYRILEIDNGRSFSYHTTYLDTYDFLFFYQHVTGKLERNKIRYRRYEATGNTFLEIKKRTNKNRTIKWRVENSLATNLTCDEKANQFIKEYIPNISLTLKPFLINQFRRITLVGTEIRERLTIDFDLAFSDTSGNQIKLPYLSIVELKKEGFSHRSPVIEILKKNSIHPNGFSKYCIGMALLYDPPRKNILKSKLLLLNKIENEFNRCLTA